MMDTAVAFSHFHATRKLRRYGPQYIKAIIIALMWTRREYEKMSPVMIQRVFKFVDISNVLLLRMVIFYIPNYSLPSPTRRRRRRTKSDQEEEDRQWRRMDREQEEKKKTEGCLLLLLPRIFQRSLLEVENRHLFGAEMLPTINFLLLLLLNPNLSPTILPLLSHGSFLLSPTSIRVSGR